MKEKKITHYDLFSGIGGFAYAIDNVYGKENAKHIFIENDIFCQSVLKKHWKDAKIYGDIRDFKCLCKKEYAQDVKKKETSPFRKRIDDGKGDIADPAKVSSTRHTELKTKKFSTNDKKSGCQKNERKSLNTMEESVPVVEKQNQNFSPLTISTMTEQKKGENTVHNRGISLSNEECPIHINYYATTVITPKESTE